MKFKNDQHQFGFRAPICSSRQPANGALKGDSHLRVRPRSPRKSVGGSTTTPERN